MCFPFHQLVARDTLTEMSRGPGRIERVITEALFANPSAIFTVADLVALAYPDALETLGIERLRSGRYVERPYIEKRYRSAILRAAKKAVPRAGWDVMKAEAPGGPPVFYNPYDLQSYACARLRAASSHFHRADLSDPKRLGDALYRELEPKTGAWWQDVEAAKLRRDGKTAEAEVIERQRERDIAALFSRRTSVG
jgi:hypothetical protein